MVSDNIVVLESLGCERINSVAIGRGGKRNFYIHVAQIFERSTVCSDGRCEEEVRRWTQAGWMSWKKVSGVLCDRKLSARVKGKMYKRVVRLAMLYGMKTVAVTERQVGKMEVAELKMVRRALVMTRKENKRSEYVRGTAKITKLGDGGVR